MSRSRGRPPLIKDDADEERNIWQQLKLDAKRLDGLVVCVGVMLSVLRLWPFSFLPCSPASRSGVLDVRAWEPKSGGNWAPCENGRLLASFRPANTPPRQSLIANGSACTTCTPTLTLQVVSLFVFFWGQETELTFRIAGPVERMTEGRHPMKLS